MLEHKERDCSHEPFVQSLFGECETTPATEWEFATSPDAEKKYPGDFSSHLSRGVTWRPFLISPCFSGVTIGTWYTPPLVISHVKILNLTWRRFCPGEDEGAGPSRRRCVVDELMQDDIVVAAGLTRAEVIAVRLATGPMLQVYNQQLSRILGGVGYTEPRLASYTTTVHAVVSALRKLASTDPCKGGAYVGVTGAGLPESLCMRDKHGDRLGCEALGFISATTCKAEAVYLSPERSKLELPPLVIGLMMSKMMRGAKLGNLSQDARVMNHILIPPMSYIELQDRPQLGEAPSGTEVLILPCTVSTPAIDTVQDTSSLRKELHLASISHMVHETKHAMFINERSLQGHDAQAMREKHVMNRILSECEENLKEVMKKDPKWYDEENNLSSAMEQAVDYRRLALTKYHLCLEHVSRGLEVTGGHRGGVLEAILDTSVHELKQDFILRKLRSAVWDFPWQSVCEQRRDEVRIPLNLEVWQVSMVWECLMEFSESVKRVMFGNVVLSDWSKPILRLPNANIGTSGAKIIAGLMNNLGLLSHVILPGNNVGPEGGVAIAGAMCRLKRLIEFDLSDNNLSEPECVQNLCKALKENTQIVSVNLCNNNFTFEDGIVIEEAINACPQIRTLSGVPIAELRQKKMTELDLSASSLGPLEAAICITKDEMHGTITYLNMVGCKIGHSGVLSLIKMLETNKTLVIVDVRDNNLSYDDGLLLLPALRKEDSKIRSFSGLPLNKLREGSLTEFSLRSMNCGPAEGAIAISHLKNNTQLVKLSLFGVRIGDKGLKDLVPLIKTMRNLESLDLRMNDLTKQHAPLIFEAIEGISTLQQICGFQHRGIKEGKVKRCVLYDLSCGECEGKMLLRLLRDNRSLTHMDLRGTTVGDDGLGDLVEFVGNNSELKHLDLRENESLSFESSREVMAKMLPSLEVVSEVPVSQIRDNKITVLNLKDKSIGDFGGCIAVDLIHRNTSITSLSLMGVGLGAWAIPGIVRFFKASKVLTSIDIRGNKFDLAHGFEVMAALGGRRTEIQSFSLVPLAAMMRGEVAELALRASVIGPCEIAIVCEAIRDNSSVKVLDLSENGYPGAEAIVRLTEALQTSKGLLDVDLRGNSLTAKEGEALMQALGDTRGMERFCGLATKKLRDGELRTIDLYSKKVGPMEGVSIGRILMGTNKLEMLDLTRNALGTDGISALAPCFCYLTNLVELSLGSNNIGAEGGKALSKGLVHLTLLERLYLYENDLGPEGCAAVSQGLEGTLKLKQLYLSYNRIEDKGCVALSAALPVLTNLESIGLQNNSIGVVGWADFATALTALPIINYVNLQGHGLMGEDMTRAASKIRMAMAGRADMLYM